MSQLSDLSAKTPARAGADTRSSRGADRTVASQQNVTRQLPVAAASSSATGFAALALSASTALVVQQAAGSAVQHWYGSDPASDVYWEKQPAAVRQLREISDPAERAEAGAQLASQGYQIDVPIMIWGWNAGKTVQLRQDYGYTWVPSMMQQPVSAAPGIVGAGFTPYDPKHPPPGSISV